MSDNESYRRYDEPAEPAYTPAAMPGPAPFPARRPRRSRPSGLFTASVLGAALLIGGGAGIGGAAGYAWLTDEETSPIGSSMSSAGTTEVADTPDVPAAEGSVEQVANSVLPSVVKINVTSEDGAGSGSGIILSADGEILTNQHVVEIAENGGNLSVSFNDGTSAPAEVVGTDPLTDTAVIKAEGVDGLTPATIGQSSNLDVGEQVVAVGSPFGLEATVTSGIVSALNRPVSAGTGSDGASTTYPAVQTDAAINPGNSGGPLVNMQAEVVGINSSIRSASSGAVGEEAGSIGLGFAIPISEVLPIVDQLRGGETPTHARLGVTVADAPNEDGVVSGARVRTVEEGSAAAEAGIEKGDVVTMVGDQMVTGSDSLVATIRSFRPGDRVELTVVGSGDPRSVTVELGSDEGTPTS